MVSIFLGILVATILMAAAPVYLNSLERQSIKGAVEQSVKRIGSVFFHISVNTNFVPLDAAELDRTDRAHATAMQENVGPIVTGTHRHLHTQFYTVSIIREVQPALVPAEREEVTEDEEGDAQPSPGPHPGLVQSLGHFEQHVDFVEGRPPRDVLLRGVQGPMIEVAISTLVAEEFGPIVPGDILIVSPSLDSPSKVSARVVGIIEPKDEEDPYWQGDAMPFLFPHVPDEDGDPEYPALGLFTPRGAMTRAIGSAFQGSVVDSSWFTAVDPVVLASWSKDEMRRSMDGIEDDLATLLPDSWIFSGIQVMLIQFGKRSFLTSVPLLLLLAILGVTILYFLFMIVSYLVPNRESDVALFRSRGTDIWRLLKLYLLEGTVLVVIAAAIAPIVALAGVWLAGVLPYFQHITGGSPLPVEVNWMPFAAAGVAGVLCLTIFVVPGVLGARSSLIIHRLRSSRPPSEPLVQRYYIDVMLLAVGAVLFWELQARGELVSGSLFGQQDVNEALLVAPVLFLLAVGMMFFRAFPMFVRYVGGESLTLIHVATAITLFVLGPAIAIADFRAGDRTGWVPEIAGLCAFGAVYWMTAKSSGWLSKALLTVIQIALISVLMSNRLPDPDTSAAVFVGSIALIAIVPAQVVFYGLCYLVPRAPVSVSISIWHMARNPLQYSWLVLLLVLSGGIGIVATTVGATLDRSYEERIRYNVGSDIRVTSRALPIGVLNRRLQETYTEIPGVESMALALRRGGWFGAGAGGRRFSVLAVDSSKLDTWFRGDFADQRPPRQVLDRLEREGIVKRTPVSDGATQLQIWVKPATAYPLIFLWIVVEDANGRMETISLGEMQYQGWTLVVGELPERLMPPFSVVSIQLNEPGFGATGTVGEVVFDSLQAVIGSTGEVVVLEDFDDPSEWVTLPTTTIGADELVRTTDDVLSGTGAALFSFGKETNDGIRGIYRTDGNGFLPAIASTSFAARTGAAPGSGLLVKLPGGVVPIVVVDTVDYFPTLDPGGWGFLIFDIEPFVSYMGALDPIGNPAVNEFFLTVRPGFGLYTLDKVDGILRHQGEAIGVEALLEAQRVDPLISAGWRTMILVAMAAVTFMGGLGYVVYLLAFAERSEGEMASLRSLGFSRLQTIGLVGLEHLLIAFIGLGVGTWSGFQMSRMIVSSVAVTDGGGRVLPPFILTTDWVLMGSLYAALIGLFVVALLTLGRRVMTLDLRRLSRMEG